MGNRTFDLGNRCVILLGNGTVLLGRDAAVYVGSLMETNVCSTTTSDLSQNRLRLVFQPFGHSFRCSKGVSAHGRWIWSFARVPHAGLPAGSAVRRCVVDAFKVPLDCRTKCGAQSAKPLRVHDAPAN